MGTSLVPSHSTSAGQFPLVCLIKVERLHRRPNSTSLQSRLNIILAKMKNSLIVAAIALLGSSSAAIHKAKLQKIPLAEQLVSISFLGPSSPPSTIKT